MSLKSFKHNSNEQKTIFAMRDTTNYDCSAKI